ncbi:MAG: molecular chaperone DnaJ [Chloroflexi bacterium]|nr:molecular chaperone DnaJ [Chloroflexota bacterium]MDA1146779.1 molecular chaperone DnaJ [Chloroflexota bacterium]MQC82851.1 molecular chaperone DnaJ [Chloroflexota bacterium]PKB56629.1 MAG: molecular chaperone DnaJ [SAR202 cluster bacterium Casp-Chloro-G1]
MTTQQDPYSVLGVTRDASAEDIKRAFRKLAMEFHPDRNKTDGAETRFKSVNAAYEVLSDPEKRARFDRFGQAEGGGQGFAGFESMGGFGDIFDAFFRGTAARRAGPQRGGDLEARLTIQFEDSIFGAEKEITFHRTENCPDCRGSGQRNGAPRDTCEACQGNGEIRRVQQSLFGQYVNVAACPTCSGEGSVVTDACSTCKGQGQRRVRVSQHIKVPAGVEGGSQIRFAGQGDAGARGGPGGNLYIELQVEPHELFTRSDRNLIYELPLNIAQAALGTTSKVPTIDGDEIELELKPGTQHGEMHTIKERGVPHLRGAGRGDLLVRTHVVTPKKLSEDQKELLLKLAESLGTPEVPEDSSIFDRIRGAFG